MASPEISFGRSLPVPSVQEMARELRGAVPRRYLRPDQEPPVSLEGAAHPLVPVIDMRRLLQEESMAEELEKLHSAAKEWGFFQLINHGVSSSLIEKMKVEVQGFFQLPLEEKNRLAQLPGNIEGYGQSFVLSEEQKLEWGDVFSLSTRPAHFTKPYIFDNLSPSFRETMEKYGLELEKLALAVTEQLARALAMDPKEILELFEDGLQTMRMSYYPECPQPEQVIGLCPHSDAAALTILLQVNEVQGLEIRKDEAWVPVKPLPGAFIVNIGDVLEIISNGIYPSIEHRVTVNSVKERLSIATFHFPKVTTEIGPAASLINSDTKPAVFKRVVVGDYLKALFAGGLKGKALINSFRVGA